MQINLSLSELKRIIGIEFNTDDSFFIENISSLERASCQDIAVLIDRGELSVFDPIALEKIKRSGAGLILAKKDIVPGKKYLLVEDPLAAFNKIVAFVEEQQERQENLISSSAVISESAILEKNVKIGPLCVIQGRSQIGSGTQIKPQVFIGKKVVIGCNVKIYSGAKILDGCSIGDNSIIHSGTVIGSDGYGYSVTKLGLKKIPQIGVVRIGKNVEIGANCSIDRAAFDETVIGDGVKIDNQVHIAHNVKIGDYTAILAQTGVAGGVEIGIACQIGGQVAIKDHVKIGNGVKIVSKSGVMRDINDGEIVAGIPCMPFGQWKRVSVIVSRLPEFLKDFSKLKSFLDEKRKKVSFLKKLFG